MRPRQTRRWWLEWVTALLFVVLGIILFGFVIVTLEALIG